MRTFSCLLIIALTAVHAVAEPEIKGTPAELTQYLDTLPRTVRLSGMAELKLSADRALIYLAVVTEKSSLQEASRSNQEIRTKILNALKERGITEDRIKASKFSSTPQYGWFGEKAKSYRVNNVIKITAQDEKEFQAVAKLVDSISEVRYDHVEFEVSDRDSMKTKVLTQAIDKVNEKKLLYEEKLGIKLAPKGFTGNASAPEPPRQREGYGYPASKMAAGDYLASTRNANVVTEQEMPSSFGELVFTAEVTVEYAVTGK